MYLMSAYNQNPMDNKDIPKTTFIMKYGLYEPKTCPFGLKTAHAIYQGLMQLALQWTCCLIYLYDVILHGKIFDEHPQFLVLQRF